MARAIRYERTDKVKKEQARYYAAQIPGWRVEVKKMNKRATRYLETRMETMKDVLARFPTALLPVEGNTDESVVE